MYCADLLKLITHVRRRLPQVTANHALAGQDFRELAAGRGSAAAMRQLIDAQRTLRRTLLPAVYQAASIHPAVGNTVRTRLRAAWGALTAADAERPDAVDRVLGHPFFRLWAVRCLGRLRAPRAGQAGSLASALEADLGYLSTLAASAAIRTGATTEITVPVAGGAVLLPTLGRLVLGPDRAGQAAARLVIDRDVVRFQFGGDGWKLPIGEMTRSGPDPMLAGDGPRPAEWQPARFLTASGVRVALEDGDPYRDCYGTSVLPRLSGGQFAEWQQAFAGAWAEIESRYPDYAPAIGAGLMALVPMDSGPGSGDGWATERQAFGAVAVSRAADPSRLGRLIVTAFQRAKFGAMLDLFDLCDPAAPDAQSVGDLLEAAYVGLAGGAQPDISEVIGATADRAVLTPEGRRFVAELRRSM